MDVAETEVGSTGFGDDAVAWAKELFDGGPEERLSELFGVLVEWRTRRWKGWFRDLVSWRRGQSSCECGYERFDACVGVDCAFDDDVVRVDVD